LAAEVSFDRRGVVLEDKVAVQVPEIRFQHPVSVEFADRRRGLSRRRRDRTLSARLFRQRPDPCIMTQLHAFSRRLEIPLTTIAVNAWLHWQARQRGRGPYESDTVAFTLAIDLGGDARSTTRSGWSPPQPRAALSSSR
jgi:hypothetical protein